MLIDGGISCTVGMVLLVEGRAEDNTAAAWPPDTGRVIFPGPFWTQNLALILQHINMEVISTRPYLGPTAKL